MIRINPNSVYAVWLERIVENHRTRAWGQPRAAEDEAAEEWYHDHWEDMTERQRLRLWGLAADLNSLEDNEKFVDSDWPPATEDELRREQAGAFSSGDWDKLLESLRRPPRFRPRADVNYARGRAWMEMGHPEVALLFFDNASRLKSDNLAFPTLALQCLTSIPKWPDAIARAEQYGQSPDAPARLLFKAGDVYHLHALHFGDAEDHQKAIAMVDRGFQRLAAGDKEPIQSIIAGAYATKALSLQDLARRDEALSVLDQAVARFPDDSTLITARGLLKRELGRADAMGDFWHAVGRNSPLVWPYLELAREGVRVGDYGPVPELCRQGLARAKDDAVAAQFFEFLAIALFSLGDSPQTVRGAFDAAVELDPMSAELSANRALFERTLGTGEKNLRWRVFPGSPLAALRGVRDSMSKIAA